MAKKTYKLKTYINDSVGECEVKLTAHDACVVTQVLKKISKSINNPYNLKGEEYMDFQECSENDWFDYELKDIDSDFTNEIEEKEPMIPQGALEMQERAKKFFKSLMEDEALYCDNNQMDGHKEYERMEGSLPSNPEEMIPFNDIIELKNQEIKADISGLTLGSLTL